MVCFQDVHEHLSDFKSDRRPVTSQMFLVQWTLLTERDARFAGINNALSLPLISKRLMLARPRKLPSLFLLILSTTSTTNIRSSCGAKPQSNLQLRAGDRHV